MRIDIITLFPDMFSSVFGQSILKRAIKKGIVQINIHNLRKFTYDNHRTADDRPFGGGSGMVMKPEPVFEAVECILEEINKSKVNISGSGIRSLDITVPRIILLCPQGKKLTQGRAVKLSKEKHIIFICGHYEGVDERVREYLVTDEISIGDYVLTCGELPAMVTVDSIVRLVPGVLGDENSALRDSFSENLLEYPQYTRPAVYRDMKVPDVLLSGNHKKIKQWRDEQSLSRTKRKRPDLIKE